MLPLADIGPGWVSVLAPLVNIVALVAVYKLTGKSRDELEGTVIHAKNQIKNHLDNGVTERLDCIQDTLTNHTKRLDKKRKKIEAIQGDLTTIDNHLSRIEKKVDAK